MPVWLVGILSYLGTKVDLFSIGFFVASNLRVPWIRRISLTDEQIADLQGKLQHGDLLFGRRNWFLKNRIVPGFYKHVATWDAKRHQVIEFQDSGYEENTLRTFISRYTDVGVGSPPFSPEYRVKFIERMRTFSEKKYDSRFSRNTESMYCSESIYDADAERILGYEPTDMLWFSVFVPDKILSLPTVKKVITITKPGTIDCVMES